MRQDPNNYWEQLERLEKLIRASEFKAGVVFSFHSLILGIFIDRLEQLRPLFIENKFSIVICILWMIAVFISIFYCFKCFKPQIELSYDKNVFFFQDAVRAYGGEKEYTKKLLEVCADEKELFEQLGEQIHAESKIIDQKFKCVRYAIGFFALSFLFVILVNAIWVLQLYF